MLTYCVQGEGGGQMLADFCVRPLWMDPYISGFSKSPEPLSSCMSKKNSIIHL